MEYPFQERVALVTGASRGIGAAFVRELAARGIGGMVLVARAKEEMEELAQEVRLKYAFPHNAPLVILPADLSDPNAPTAIKAETDRLGLQVDLLINNAGFGSHGFFHEATPQKELDMVQVNISSLIALTRLYLPEMIDRRQGAIINVSSTAAFQPVPYMATYAATKAFVQSFSEALWSEMEEAASPVRILALCPGGTTTNFGDGLTRGRFENMPHDTPDRVARVGLDAISTDASYAVVGSLNYIGSQLPRFLPRTVVSRVAGQFFRPGEEVSFAPFKVKRETLALVAATAGVATAALLLLRRSNNK